MQDATQVRFPIGCRVVIVNPKQPRWHDEPGFVVATHPPLVEEPDSYVVRLDLGREVICQPEQLKEIGPKR